MSGPDKLSAKDQVLVAVHELEQVVQRFGLPCVVVVVLPKTKEAVKMAGGLDAFTLPQVAKLAADYLRSRSRQLDRNLGQNNQPAPFRPAGRPGFVRGSSAENRGKEDRR